MSASPQILTLDIGTTAVKAALFDTTGRLLATGCREYALEKNSCGWLELNPGIYWQAAVESARSALQKNGTSNLVQALAVTSQGETLIVVDGKGKPLRPAIVWLDTRSTKEAAEIGQAFDPETIYRITGQQEMLPAWTATRIAWLRRHESEVFAKAARYLLVADYLLYRLTGRFVSDSGLNPSTLYFDLRNKEWWTAMLHYLGISESQLPELIGPGAVAGELTAEAAAELGVARGIPVASAPIDQVCGAIGAGNIKPGMISENTGAALALAAGMEELCYDPQRRVGVYLHGVGGYLFLPWAPTAGMALRWFRDNFGGGADYDQLCREAAHIPPGADGLLLLPHFSGACCPRVAPAARAAFYGLTLGHTRAHMVRALLEAIAFLLRGNLEMLAQLGIARKGPLRALGGASRSTLWLQIKADVCGCDLLAMECNEATSLGAALLAAVAVGWYPDHHAAAQGMVRPAACVSFSPERHAVYNKIYQRYCALENMLLAEALNS